jgi:hypothetical protein
VTNLLLILTLLLTPQTARRPDDEELKRLSRRADVVVVAEVKKVEPTSELQPWSGLTSSWQFVRYEVKEVLKGEFPTGEVKVGFILVKNSLTADKSRPALSLELFKEHNVHIVFLDLDRLVPEMGTRYAGVSQDYGAILFTPEAAAAVRALSSESKDGEEGRGP